MKLTARLLKLLHRVFDKDPHSFLALRLRYAGAMRWAVQDGVLTTTVTGGPGAALSVDLRQYTLSQLVAFLAAQPGYTVAYADTGNNAQLGARVLLDASGDQAASNGDHLYGYTSVLWAYLETMASELDAAADQIAEMLRQLSLKTASDVWLDELGGYYGVPRLVNESDAAYAPRLIAEVLRPRSNNIAIAQAIKEWTGQTTVVTDVASWAPQTLLYNNTFTHNSAHNHDAAPTAVYALFDVQYGYDLENGGSLADFQAAVSGVVSRLRASGTFLRSLSLSGSLLQDEFPGAPTDLSDMPLVVAPALSDDEVAGTDTSLAFTGAYLGLADDAAAGSDDGISLSITGTMTYNGLRLYDGSIGHWSTTFSETV